MEKIELTIKDWVGNKVKWDYNNDGTRDRLEKGYRKGGRNAKFTIPSGKRKCVTFPENTTDEEILADIQKKYSNYQFTLTKTASKETSGTETKKII